MAGHTHYWLSEEGGVGRDIQITVTSYTPGTLTIPTGYGSTMTKRLALTTTQRVTLQGTARLRIN